MVLALWACQRNRTVALPPPPPPRPATFPAPVPIPASVPDAVPAAATADPAVRTLEQADAAFVAGNYRGAATAYENYLQLSPDGDMRDEALFRLGLVYALPGGPSQDWSRATSYLKRLLDEHPASPLKAPATLILSLQADITNLTADGERREQRIRQLTGEIEKLKMIDTTRRNRP
jgi:TolA-binding protein